MDISSLSASSLQSLFSLQSLYSKQNSQSTSGSTDNFSELLKTSDSSSANSTQNSDSLAMLKALMSGSSVNCSDLLLKAIDKTDSDKSTDNVSTLLSMLGTSSSSDPFIQAFDSGDSNSGEDSLSFVQGLEGSGSNSQSIDSFYNSDLALTEALQKSGMSSEKVAQVFKQVEANSQYTDQGTKSSSNAPSGLFSATA